MTERPEGIGAEPEGEPGVIVVPDAGALTQEAASRIAAALAAGVADRGRADWATTGGSTAPGIYRRLAEPPLRDAVPWNAVHVWWGDDRFVPRDHPLSNVKPLDDILLAFAQREEGQLGLGTTATPQPVPIPIDHLHPFPTTQAIGAARGAAWCAEQLAAELRGSGLAEVDGWPVLDLVVLGVGPDGHILSVFPGSPALEATELALAVPAPSHIEPRVERVTLNPGLVRVARGVVVAAGGSEKAPVIGRIFGPERDAARWPAQLARRTGAVWILDAEAAAELSPPPRQNEPDEPSPPARRP